MNFVSEKAKKVYSFIFSISFILNGYASGIPGISLGTLVFIFYSVYALVVVSIHKKNVKIGKKGIYAAPIVTILFLCFISLFGLFTSSGIAVSYNDMIFTVAKLMIITISVSIVPYIFTDYHLLFKWLVRIATLVTLYLIVQYVAYYVLSIRLTNIFEIGFLKAYVEGHGVVGDIYTPAIYFRPASFFVEPSYYGIYVLCILTVYLYDTREKVNKKNILYSLYLSFGIILSTSTASIYLLILVWGIYLFKYKKNYKVFLVYVFLIFVLIIILIVIMNNSSEDIYGMFGSAADTIRYTLEKPQNFSESSRLGKSYDYFNYLKGLQKFIGIGVGNEGAYLSLITGGTEIYMNSVTLLLMWGGYIGLVMYAFFIMSLIIRNTDECSQLLILIFIIKGFSSGMFFNYYSILILTIIIVRSKYGMHKVVRYT